MSQLNEDEENCSKGLETSYLRLVNAIETFKRTFEGRETLLRGDLSKMNTEKLTRKKVDDEINSLKLKVNTTMDSLNMQSELINSLISNAFNYSDRYINMRQTVENVSCQKQ